MKDFIKNIKVREIIKKALEDKIVFFEEINSKFQNDFAPEKIDILINGMINQGIKVVGQIDFFEDEIKKYEESILSSQSIQRKYKYQIEILEDNIKRDILNIDKLKNKIRYTKNNKISNYLDILDIGLELKTQRGIPFEIINVYDELRIRNSKGNEYKINEKILKDYILKKDFDNSRRHYSYEPSIAKYIVEQLDEN